MDETKRNRATMEAIGSIYCRGNHPHAMRDAGDMRTECRASIERTLERAASCPNGHEGNCQDCSTHCQRGESQQAIRRIMRYSAPRMALSHPIMTARYLGKKLASGRQRAATRRTAP